MTGGISAKSNVDQRGFPRRGRCLVIAQAINAAAAGANMRNTSHDSASSGLLDVATTA